MPEHYEPNQSESKENQNKQELMLNKQHIKEAFETQYQEPLPHWAQRCGCGVASLETSLRSLGHLQQDHSQFTLEYMSRAKFSVPAVGVEVVVDNKSYILPVSFSATQTIDQVQQNALAYLTRLGADIDQLKLYRIDQSDAAPMPAFTFEHGFDHRGIDPFLKEKQLPYKAELYQNDAATTISQMETAFQTDAKPTVLFSVNQVHLGYPVGGTLESQAESHYISTHIISIHDIVEIDGVKAALVTDPAFETPEDGVQIKSLKLLADTYAGRATFIIPDQSQPQEK